MRAKLQERIMKQAPGAWCLVDRFRVSQVQRPDVEPACQSVCLLLTAPKEGRVHALTTRGSLFLGRGASLTCRFRGRSSMRTSYIQRWLLALRSILWEYTAVAQTKTCVTLSWLILIHSHIQPPAE